MAEGLAAWRGKNGMVTIAISRRHHVTVPDDRGNAWFEMSAEDTVEFAGMLLRVGTEHLREEKKNGDQGPP